jgi:DNA-binding beta-propeller fold protein YncE
MTIPSWTPVENWEGTRADWQRRDVPGVAVDAEDNVYVFSRDEENPVTVYGSDGARIRAWGTGVFKRPHAIRIDADGFVWCVDDGDHTVRKLTREGEPLMMLGQPERPSENGAGSADGSYGTFDYRDVSRGGPPFNGPTDVCILSDGTVFVTDGYGNARVHRFSPDGGLELSWGQPGSGPGEFRLPHGIVAAPEQDRLFVLDRENNRVQVFDRDGRFLEQWAHFVRPCGIAISRDGTLCIVELGERAGRWPHMAPLTPDTPARPVRPRRSQRHDRRTAGRGRSRRARVLLRAARRRFRLPRQSLRLRGLLRRRSQPHRPTQRLAHAAEIRPGLAVL